MSAPARYRPKKLLRARLCDSVSGRHRAEENLLLTKHVVAAGRFAKDAGSTPAASTILNIERKRRLPCFARQDWFSNETVRSERAKGGWS